MAAASTPARGQSGVRAASHTTLPAEDSSRVTLALAVGGQRFDEVTRGRCVHAPRASIFNTLSSMWMVNYAPAPGRSIALTVWRPMTGDTTPQINFNVSTGGKSQRIETVRAAEIVGKGSVRITKRGAGGRFDIVGTTGDGATVRGSIECEKFAAPAPVGGN
jgi:hypothetical protein